MTMFGRAPRTGASSPGWAVTMTDLGFLILTFFILQYAMSSPRQQPWAAAEAALVSHLGPGLAPLPTEDVEETPPTAPGSQSAVALDYLASLINARLDDTGMGEALHQGDALVVRVGGDVVLDDGTRAGFGAIAAALQFVPNDVRLETTVTPASSDGPGATAAWRLAMARGLEVAAQLRNGGLKRPVKVVARITPVATTATLTEPQVGEIEIIISAVHGDDS